MTLTDCCLAFYVPENLSPLCKGLATSMIKRIAHETHPLLALRSLQPALHDWPFAVCSLLSASPLQRPNLNPPSAPCFTRQARDSPPGRMGDGRTMLARFKVRCVVKRGPSVTGQRARSISLRSSARRGHSRRPHGHDGRGFSARSGDVVKAGAGTARVRVLSLTRSIFRRSETDQPFRRKDDGRMVRYRVVCERVQTGDRRQGAGQPLNAGEIHVGNL